MGGPSCRLAGVMWPAQTKARRAVNLRVQSEARLTFGLSGVLYRSWVYPVPYPDGAKGLLFNQGCDLQEHVTAL